jgi:DNA-binding Lrp family transcriptional regulator
MISINPQKMEFNIIKVLNSNSKHKFSAISERLNISRKTFQNYFDKLKTEKMISNFTININPNIRPNLKYVIMEIKTNPKEPKLVEELLKIPQLKILDGIFGEFSLIALFIFKDAEDFNKALVLIDKIMSKSYFKKYNIIETIKVYKTNGIELSTTSVDLKRNLDNFDYSILQILQNEQGLKQVSTYEIRDKLKQILREDISQPSISKRIEKLKNMNIILNYTINFNPKSIGFKGKYIIRIKPNDPSKYNDLALKLEKKNEITDLFRIGEQYGLFAIVRVQNIKDYGKFIHELYYTEEIEDTFTNFVLDELKPYTNFIIF